jgi:hypothetical protein
LQSRNPIVVVALGVAGSVLLRQINAKATTTGADFGAFPR